MITSFMGQRLIVPSNRIVHRPSGDAWATHGNLVSSGPGTMTDGSIVLTVQFILKDGSNIVYNYFRTTAALADTYHDALTYVSPFSGLTGGEFFNRIVRPNLVGINGYPI